MKTRIRRPLSGLLLLCALSALPVSAMAQTGDSTTGSGTSQHRPPHGPPPEALQACASKAAQAACSFSDRSGRSMSGICEVDTHAQDAGSSSALSCRPAGMPDAPGRRPPDDAG